MNEAENKMVPEEVSEEPQTEEEEQPLEQNNEEPSSQRNLLGSTKEFWR